MRRRGSVLTQLLIVFSVFAVLIGGATVGDFIAVARQNNAANQVTGRYTVLQQEESALEAAYGTAQFAVFFANSTGQPSYLSTFPAARAAFNRNLALLRRNETAALRPLISEQARAGDDWFRLAPKVVAVTPRTASARALYAQSNQISVRFLAYTTQILSRLHSEVERLTASSKDALRTGLTWSGVAAAVAVLLVLAASLSTLYTVTRPLRALAGTVGRLTAGDHSARARVHGSAEVREVAESVNRQADEADRLRAREAEHNRLRAAAREAGMRIREPLLPEDVLREARLALEQIVEADHLSLRLIEEDRVAAAPGEPRPQAAGEADEFGAPLADDVQAELREMFAVQRSAVIQDVQGRPGEAIPQPIRDIVRRAGVQSQIVTPFGVGGVMMGVVILRRLTDRPWTPAEVDAVESIAADLGRGLNHARLYEAEDRLVENLRSLDRAKSDFFATVSHELRSPLTTIEGYVEMLGEDDRRRLDDDQRRMVQAIDRSAVRLRNLIEDVFTLAKLESGAFETMSRPVQVAELVSDAVEAIQPSVADKRLSLAVTAPEGGLVVDGDPGQLHRVLVNLLSNAVKFTPEGQVTLAAATEDCWVSISVADTGIGIPDRDQPQLFSRFFRASNAVERAIPGTGLGLAIVRTIVASHGGEIAVQSAEGAGTTVTVRLPRRQLSGTGEQE